MQESKEARTPLFVTDKKLHWTAPCISQTRVATVLGCQAMGGVADRCVGSRLHERAVC
jgi:hypothetical protein